MRVRTSVELCFLFAEIGMIMKLIEKKAVYFVIISTKSCLMYAILASNSHPHILSYNIN